LALGSLAMKTAIGILLLVAFLGIVVVVAILSVGQHPENASQPVAKDECGGNSMAYLIALKEGDSIAAAFWKPGTTPKTLFAVHDFNQIKYGAYLRASGRPYKVRRVFYEFEVESSTKGGFPIRKRWDVVLEPDSKNFGGRPCAIVALDEAE